MNYSKTSTSVLEMSEIEHMLPILTKCYKFAAIKHKTQLRKDGITPYINHPIGVADILCNEAGVTDPVVIQAAVLHDTVEDTDTTFAEIEKEFGPEVTHVVKEVTDDKTLPKDKRKQLQIEHAPHISQQAKLVKLADKLYNLRDINRVLPQGWSEERGQEYFVWAHKVVSGLSGTNSKMEQKLNELFKERGVVK